MNSSPEQLHFPWKRILLLLLLGATVRILRLTAQPLSGDEAYSVVIWIQTSLQYLLQTIALATTEPHPPLALLAMHGWAQLAGDSIFAVRMFAVFNSLIALAALYAITRRLGGHRAALIALLLGAVSPFQLWYGQFARNYSLWMALSALSLLSLLHAWKHPKSLISWVPYILTAILTGYVFYLEVFHYLAHNIYALTHVWKRRDLLLPWILTQITIAAALSPWYLRPELRLNSQQYRPNGTAANPLWGLQTLLVGDTLPPFLQNSTASSGGLQAVGLASILVLILVTSSIFLIWKTRSRSDFWFTIITALTPIMGLTLLSLVTHRRYFHPRYLAASAIPLTVLVGLGIECLSMLRPLSQRAQRTIQLATLAILIAISVIGIYHYEFDPAFAKGPDWPRIMAVLSEQTRPADVIIYNYPDPAFTYYFQHNYSGGSAVEFLPEESRAPYDEVALQMEQLAATHDVIWFMPVPVSYWDTDQTVAQWLNLYDQPLSDQWIGDTHLFQYGDWEASSNSIAVPLDKSFDGVAMLAGYRITPPLSTWQPGDTVSIVLFWQPTAHLDHALKSFLHLRGPAKPDGSPLWAQDDRFSQAGSTTEWPSDILLRDAYQLTLPADLPAGLYTVYVGFYEPDTQERIPLLNPAPDDDPDSAALFSITFPNP